MRLRRLELFVIGLTLAFLCFLGGYFTGLKGAVNIVTVSAQDGDTQQIRHEDRQQVASAADTPVAPAPASDAGVQSAAPVADDAGAPAGNADGMPRVSDGRININLASRSELMDLPGIGSVLAERIVEYRQQYGAFARIEDLRKVSGIGEKRFAAIRDLVTVG